MYEIINLLLRPYFVLLAAIAIGVLVVLFRGTVRRRWKLLLVLAVASLIAMSTPVVTYFTLGTLEWRYPPVTERPADLDAIVILSAGIYPPDAVRPAAVLGERTINRCLRGAELFAQGEPCPIVVAGGRVDPERAGPTLAGAMVDLMHGQFGIAREHFLVEETSRTTHENAVNCSEMLRKRNLQRVALVTDATHMHRAVLCFRKQGLDVIPIACSHRATELTWELDDFLPNPGDAVRNQAVFHEYLGMLWYYFQGRI
ncbi:MAG: YdcF family protein [Planctomycetota bacterium]|nr:MAG: YdcF family protein [Planctomycetota bacterium]REK46073.1 MAG: YdcF family protein [Planctomycetota bacterium]